MNTIRKVGLVALALILCAALFTGCRCDSSHSASLPTILGLTALGAVGFLMKDALLKVTKTLPNAASTTVNSTGIDLQEGTRGDFLADVEILITAPALNTTILPDTRTMTYSLYHDTDPAFGTETLVYGAAGQIVQTGAGGVGAALATFRGRLPTTVKQYIRLKIASGASTTDASATSATLEVLA
jgi:hypothetical protein